MDVCVCVCCTSKIGGLSGRPQTPQWRARASSTVTFVITACSDGHGTVEGRLSGAQPLQFSRAASDGQLRQDPAPCAADDQGPQVPPVTRGSVVTKLAQLSVNRASVDGLVPQVSTTASSTGDLVPVPQASEVGLARPDPHAAAASSDGRGAPSPSVCCELPPVFAAMDHAILRRWSPHSDSVLFVALVTCRWSPH